jgi:uncharacterized membrane protein YdjX (TVP38/TMEM64 family)
MSWLAAVLLRVAELGSWGPVLFALLYIAAAVTMAPAFLLTVAAGALFGVWRGSLLVFVSATLGASAAYAVASRLAQTRLFSWLVRDRRVAVVRLAVAGEGAWVQFLLRLSPIVPYVLLNYALGLSRVRFRDFLVACIGMIPAIVMYTYYGKVVGDVAKLAAGVAPPRGAEYYVLLGVGVVATVAASMAITRAARRAIDEQRRLHQ